MNTKFHLFWQLIVGAVNKKIVIAAMLLGASLSAQAVPVYVGSWDLYNSAGPSWSTFTVPTYTAQEAAAKIFGGFATDYVISTAGSNPSVINHMAWLDQIYIGVGKFGESYRVDSNNNGIYDVSGDTSAWVKDNACCNTYFNYAFRAPTNIPEPASLALMGLGFAGLATTRRRKIA